MQMGGTKRGTVHRCGQAPTRKWRIFHPHKSVLCYRNKVCIVIYRNLSVWYEWSLLSELLLFENMAWSIWLPYVPLPKTGFDCGSSLENIYTLWQKRRGITFHFDWVFSFDNKYHEEKWAIRRQPLFMYDYYVVWGLALLAPVLVVPYKLGPHGVNKSIFISSTCQQLRACWSVMRWGK